MSERSAILLIPHEVGELEVTGEMDHDKKSEFIGGFIGGESLDAQAVFSQPEEFPFRYSMMFCDDFLTSIYDGTDSKLNVIASILHYLAGYQGDIYGNAYLAFEMDGSVCGCPSPVWDIVKHLGETYGFDGREGLERFKTLNAFASNAEAN